MGSDNRHSDFLKWLPLLLPTWLKWRLMMFSGERKVVDFPWVTFQVSSIPLVMGKLLCQVTYFISLSEDLARAQAGPKRLNDCVGTSMQCGDPGAGGDWTQSPLPFQGAAFHPGETAGPQLGAPGACFQHPRWSGGGRGRRGWLLQTFQTLGLWFLLPPFLPRFALSLILQPLGSVYYAPNLVPGAGTPGMDQVHGPQVGHQLIYWGLYSTPFWGPSSVQFSHSVVSDSLRPYELQHPRPLCPSLTLRVHTNSCL